MSASGPPAAPSFRARQALSVALVLVGLLALVAALYVYMNSGRAVSVQGLEPADKIQDSFAALREVDPKLIKYRQVSQIPTGLREPRGITVAASGNSLYVVGDQSLVELGMDGARKQEVPLPAPAYCVDQAGGEAEPKGDPETVTPAGPIYVGFQDHLGVYEVTLKAGAAWTSLGPSARITSVAAHGDDVYVADAGNRVVWYYGVGAPQPVPIGRRDDKKKVPGLLAPSPYLDLALQPVNRQDAPLWVTNPGRRSVEAYVTWTAAPATPGTPKGATEMTAAQFGNLKLSWGEATPDIEGFCGCCNPTDLAVLPDGQVVTSEKGLPRVKVYTPDGKLDAVVARPADLSVKAAGLDLAVDAKGRIYVLDRPARVIRVFERKTEGQDTKQ